MSSPLPPILNEEQLRTSQAALAKSNRRRGWLWLFLAMSIALNVVFYTILHFHHKAKKLHESGSIFVERNLSGDKDSENKIVVVRVEGLITSRGDGHMGVDGMVGDIKEQLRLAEEDEEVKAIILRVDSPGGEVLASDEIYRAVKHARTKKKVVCSMGSLAASGGYYSAMGAEYIIADNLTITGSIGVIMQTLNYKDLFGKIGLKSVVIKSGKFKDLLNGSRDTSTEELDLLQTLIMETYDQFVSIVSTERKITVDQLHDGIADGRVFSGKQALAVHLVDELGTFNDAVRKAKSLAKIQDARVSDYVVPFSLNNLLGIFAKSNVPRIELNVPSQSMQLEQGKMYYLSFHMF